MGYRQLLSEYDTYVFVGICDQQTSSTNKTITVVGFTMRRINQIEDYPSHSREIGYLLTATDSAEMVALRFENEQLNHRILQLEAENSQLEAHNAELDAFAHTVAHDLRTPLSWVNGYIELLLKDWQRLPDRERIDYAQSAFHGAKIMNNIVDELLLLASLKDGDITYEPIEMESVVRCAKDRLTPMLQQYDAQITLPTAFPTVYGYAPWVEGIWVNYISNAIKYGGAPPKIEVGFSEQQDNVSFWVEDNGQGLTPEQQRKLFVPFGGVAKKSPNGFGLGLSIVRRIVERLGGSVDIFSTIGEGSRFIFSLPCE